ncbi:MAG: adaptor protein MecA [Lachnospiraceae bacterium]|nr:adaptor protein MecA [Lachnospiraceae bacterium]
MKIEKLNENQIRCTLNKSDLADHNIRLTELAYGTDRAKALFRDMMQQASDDVGFEVGDIPLMIEAIPVNPDCLILIITKVEDPEELDTRFSKFTKPSSDDYDDYDDEVDEEDEDEDFGSSASIFDVLGNIVENLEAVRNASSDKNGFHPLSATAEKVAVEKEPKSGYDIYRIFVFSTLSNVTSAAEQLRGLYNGDNTLFKNPKDSRYYLILNRSEHTTDEFNLVCNTLCEFGSKLKTSYAMPYHMAEHFQPIIKRTALQTLGEL